MAQPKSESPKALMEDRNANETRVEMLPGVAELSRNVQHKVEVRHPTNTHWPESPIGEPPKGLFTCVSVRETVSYPER